MIITNTDPANLQVDGVYIDNVTPSPQTSGTAQTGLIGIEGGANWGPLNTPTPFADAPSLFAAFGTDTVSSHSLVRSALSAMPECSQFLGSRIADGTQVAATVSLTDSSAGIVATLTGLYTGSFPNAAANVTLNLQNGSIMTASPVVQAIINFPNQQAEVFSNIIAYATPGSGYSAPAFKANLAAAINGTIPNQRGSRNWSCTAGSSTLAPQTGVAFSASGGIDGTTGITTAMMIGVDGMTGRTGMYAFDGLLSAAQFVPAGLTDPTAGQTIIAFCQRENAKGHLAFQPGTTTATALATRITDNLASPSLFLSIDWDYVFDVQSGQNMYVAPMGKIAGIIAAQPAYLSPGNEPQNGVVGVIGTERISGGINSVNQQEAAARQQAGILYLGYMPRNVRGPQIGLPHGMTSDGVTRICDSRLLSKIVDDLQRIEGPLVDGPMSAASGPNLGQPTAGALQDAADAYFGTLLNSSPQQISNYDFLIGSQNTPTTIAEGLLIPSVMVQSLSSAQFILNMLQVGPNVQIVAQTA